jgi:hypothetical protein
MFSKFFAPAFFVSALSFSALADNNLNNYRTTIIELVNDGYYFSVVPWMKDYLVKHNGKLDSGVEAAFDKLISRTGVKVFESLPESVLSRSSTPNIRYILAKRLMKKGKYQNALTELKGVPGDHSSYPFIAHMMGSIYGNLSENASAVSAFKDCIRTSEYRMGKADTTLQREQLEANRDFCVAGVARSQFANKEYKQAELTYLDIPKDSFVWPEILFEEAWNSYYERNYNRTLGKLVSYKAPVFDFIFKPEVEVLKSLTYLKMCLYDDAKKTADEFYDGLLTSSKDLRSFIMNHGKNYGYYFSLMADHEAKRQSQSPMIDHILRSISKDAAFLEMKGGLAGAMNELAKVKKMQNNRTSDSLERNLQTVVEEYRSVIGAYVRAGLVSKYAELYNAFQSMSYIKLEVLALRKEKLYRIETNESGKRGDVKYIERNDKQYFWNFNGEFWADELGDYVFALRSEC